jgi:hypothetical protein
MAEFHDKIAFIFQIANHLRGPYKPNQYGEVVLPMTVLRRLDSVLAPTKDKVLEAAEKHKDKPDEAREKILNKVAGQSFHNTSKLNFEKMKGSTHLAKDLAAYIKGFSPFPMPGSTTPFATRRTGRSGSSATKSQSTATSTCTSRPARWRTSLGILRPWRPTSCGCWGR